MEEIRPSVQRFAEEMEAVLRDNDYKGGWDDCSIHYLVKKLREEVDELEDALEVECPQCGHRRTNGHNHDPEKETVDIGNVAMMIRDNVRRHRKSQN